MRNRSGLTLAELLIAIAIVGTLSALLFPVFARARAESRSSQCITNVKEVAAAITMYAADYGALFPTEHDRQAIDYFNTAPGGGWPRTYPDVCHRVVQANPYLRFTVMLSSYLPNRAVWRCPEASVSTQACWIVPPGPNGDWVQSYKDYEGSWGSQADWAGGPCFLAFPTGWGGTITDSFLQGLSEQHVITGHVLPVPGAFVGGIGVNDNLVELDLTEITQPFRYIVCGDSGKSFNLWLADGVALPDRCRTNYCGGNSCPGACANADWVNCPWTQECGVTSEMLQQMFADKSYLKAFTRHHGGANVGFFDGHAQWCTTESLLTRSTPFPNPLYLGLCSCWPGNNVMP